MGNVGMMRFVKPALAALTALGTAGCCTTPDFSLPDFRGRLDFSGSLAFDFDFDADMEFEFDGDFSAWIDLGVVASWDFDIDIEGKVAFEQEILIDIDDDGVEEKVTIIGFSDGDPDDVDTIVAAWEGDEFTFDDGYCYVLLVTEDSVTLITGECDGDSPVLTCTSPTDDPQDVSCEVCDENGECAQCESEKVSECIEEGSDVLDEIEPDEEPDQPKPEQDSGPPPLLDAGSPPVEVDAGMVSEMPEAGMPDRPEPTPDAGMTSEMPDAEQMPNI